MLAVGRGVEKGSLQKHPSSASCRKLGRQEGDGALGSLGLGKSKLKDKLSAIRQDRAERRESLQKQDAIHEVDSSEDETDEGSEDSQDGRRGAAFTPPPLLRPTTVRTGPGGTLPSLCLSPCTSHATFSHTAAPPRQPRAASTGEHAGQDGKAPGACGPPQRPFPFSTPGSAFISVGRDSFLRPAPPTRSRTAKNSAAASLQQDCTTVASAGPPEPPRTTSSLDRQTPGAQEPPGSAPGVSKEKKEADNRRLAASDPDTPASRPADGAGVPPGLPPAVDPSRGGAAEARHQPAGPRSEPSASAASEPKRKRSDPPSAASAANTSSQRDRAASKKT